MFPHAHDQVKCYTRNRDSAAPLSAGKRASSLALLAETVLVEQVLLLQRDLATVRAAARVARAR